MPAWDADLFMLVLAYLVALFGVAGWAVYARGRLRAHSAERDRRSADRARNPDRAD